VNNATADVGIFLMIGALRQAHVPLTAIRAGQWGGKSGLGHDPKGKVLGILGMGGIGRVCTLLPNFYDDEPKADKKRKWHTAQKHLE
jgi:lactate dehydrogenase-like 2-hydroxyacid dehydrogenase